MSDRDMETITDPKTGDVIKVEYVEELSDSDNEETVDITELSKPTPLADSVERRDSGDDTGSEGGTKLKKRGSTKRVKQLRERTDTTSRTNLLNSTEHNGEDANSEAASMCEECGKFKAKATVSYNKHKPMKLCLNCVRKAKKAAKKNLATLRGNIANEVDDGNDSDEERKAERWEFKQFATLRAQKREEEIDAYKPSAISWAIAGVLVRWPCLVMFISMVIPFIFAGIAFSQPFEIDSRGESFRIRNHVTADRFDALTIIKKETYYDVPKVDLAGIKEREREKPTFGISMTFEALNDQDVYRPDNLQFQRDLINALESMPGYEDYCHLVYTDDCTVRGDPAKGVPKCKCAKATSMLNFLYPTVKEITLPNGNVTTVEIPDGNGDKLVRPPAQTLKTLWENNEALLYPFVDVGFGEFNYRSTVTRSILSFGSPLPGYDNEEDRKEEQLAKFTEWITANETGALDILTKQTSDKMRVYYIGAGVTEALLDDIIVGDGMLVFGAIVFVAIYMRFHTQSSFLTGLGVLHILMSFPVAYFVFRFALGVEKFQMLNTLSIFILLGVGADDVFIVVDLFRQSAVVSPQVKQSMRHRVAWSYAKATKSMFITSLTTAAAFFANAVSLLPPIRLFGLFTGFLIIVNFVLVITWYPAVLVIWSRIFEERPDRCTPPCLRTRSKKKSDGDGAAANGDLEAANGAAAAPFSQATMRRIRQKLGVSSEPAESKKLKRGIVDVSEYRLLERFFFLRYAPFMEHHKGKILAFFIVVTMGLALQAVQLKAAEEPARFLPDDNPVQRALDLDDGTFKQTDFVNKMIVVWGTSITDRAGTDANDPEDLGAVTYYDTFDPSTSAAQEYYQKACEEARKWKYTRDAEVLCLTEELAAWANATYGDPFPLPQSVFVPRLREFALTEQPQKRSTRNPFGAGIVFNRDFLVRFHEDTDELVMIGMVVNTTLPRFVSAKTGGPILEEFDEFVATTIGTALTPPAEMGEAYHTTSTGLWVANETERVLATSAYIGIAVGLALSFLIILASTLNFLIALYCTITIGCIVIVFLGVIVSLGWSLGIIESISTTIIAGLSVDFVTHLANAYNESPFETRFERTRGALIEMGTSVLSAALTTLGSAGFLLLTVVIFFKRYGISLFITIFTSMVFAFGFFIALSLIAGPVRNQGSLRACFRAIRSKVSGKGD